MTAGDRPHYCNQHLDQNGLTGENRGWCILGNIARNPSERPMLNPQKIKSRDVKLFRHMLYVAERIF